MCCKPIEIYFEIKTTDIEMSLAREQQEDFHKDDEHFLVARFDISMVIFFHLSQKFESIIESKISKENSREISLMFIEIAHKKKTLCLKPVHCCR